MKLVRTSGEWYYWEFEMPDGEGVFYGVSEFYKTREQAVKALFRNGIAWETQEYWREKDGKITNLLIGD
jgi:hypothetical protein